MSNPVGDPTFNQDWIGSTFGGPDFTAAPWKLGYQVRQFGVGQDPGPTASAGANAASDNDTLYPYAPGIYSALADPPAAMTTAIELPIIHSAPAPQ